MNDGATYDTDTFVFLGDYVDGGPKTKQVLELMRAFQRQYPHWVFLRGNHEQMWLDAMAQDGYPTSEFDTWFYQGGMATRDSYLLPDGSAIDTQLWRQHREWVASLPLWHETDRYIFVHAGLRPPLPPAANSAQDLLWIREPFIYSTFDWGKIVVFGHTPLKAPLVLRNKIGVDTMARNGGYLTAAELSGPEPRFILGDRT